MPYEVLLKKAHELVDAASPEKIEWVVGVKIKPHKKIGVWEFPRTLKR